MTMANEPGSERYNPADHKAPGSLSRWGSEVVKDQAKGFAIGKAAEFAGRTALGARFLFVSRWLWMAYWGTLAVSVGLAVLGVVGIVQGDGFLGTLTLVVAALAFGVFLIVRAIRRFIERQIDKAYARFQQLLQRGQVRPADWPNWYKQNKNRQ